MQTTHSSKQEALNAIAQLPDNVEFDEIIYRLYVVSKIKQGLKDVEDGNTISHEELKREIENW